MEVVKKPTEKHILTNKTTWDEAVTRDFSDWGMISGPKL